MDRRIKTTKIKEMENNFQGWKGHTRNNKQHRAPFPRVQDRKQKEILANLIKRRKERKWMYKKREPRYERVLTNRFPLNKNMNGSLN